MRTKASLRMIFAQFITSCTNAGLLDGLESTPELNDLIDQLPNLPHIPQIPLRY